MSGSGEIVVAEFRPALASEWKRFLETSNNGTLFHDLDFLAYHPADRFDEHHLLVRQEGKLLAILPAAIVTDSRGDRYLQSPYGASTGGIVVQEKTRLETLTGVVAAIKAHIARSALAGAVLRLGPSVYMRRPDQSLEFALAAEGFRLTARWLCLIESLEAANAGDEGLLQQFTQSKRYDVRAALREGLAASEAGPEALDRFYDLLLGTMDRHDAQPTHDKKEIGVLYRLVPGRLRLFFCTAGNVDLSAILVFMLNGVAACTFYICGKRKQSATALLLHHIMQVLAREGIRYLDLGPSASSVHVNRGNVQFKEGFGARGFCRDEWRWDATGAPSANAMGSHA